ncbi:hypothetical protein KY284_001468 [Solanum tuberosum]|nr:hypothetical protein KY284_001468 [Solanum tuberosum]
MDLTKLGIKHGSIWHQNSACVATKKPTLNNSINSMVKMDVPASTLTRKCSMCKQIGHDRRNCPSRVRNASYGGNS